MNRLVFESKQSRAWLLPVFLLSFLSTFLPASQASAETGDHHQAYLDALDTVMEAETRIGGEMARISNGAVAHYDFLQHEHIELLRHANALRHPPIRMSASDRDIVIARADALLMAAESLELVIADFLRAEALLSSAVSNTLDLLSTQPSQRPTNAELNHLRQLTHAAREFRTDNTSETREVLYAAFDKVASLDIEQTWQSALSVQRHLIRNNSTEAVSGISKLAMAGTKSLAEELRVTYIAAMTQDYRGPK
jgi:hypothetical protein